LPEPKFPVVFLKPSSSIIGDGDAIEIPAACSACVLVLFQTASASTFFCTDG
jgi:hypothetical protein